jgi:hypothetical protein
MGLVLYRNGNTHTVNGITCELKVVDSAAFTGTVEKGWFMSVDDINVIEEIKEPVNEIVEVLEPIEEPFKINIETLSNEKTRELSKLNKIKNFDKARISTLKGKLTICQEQATLKAS